jgi:hypothetical protein
MLRQTLPLKEKRQVFQALFLSNGKGQKVEVLEDERVDFAKVQKHLENGGSIFITSKNSQKLRLKLPSRAKLAKKAKRLHFRKHTNKTIAGYYIDHL